MSRTINHGNKIYRDYIYRGNLTNDYGCVQGLFLLKKIICCLRYYIFSWLLQRWKDGASWSRYLIVSNMPMYQLFGSFVYDMWLKKRRFSCLKFSFIVVHYVAVFSMIWYWGLQYGLRSHVGLLFWYVLYQSFIICQLTKKTGYQGLCFP